MRLRRWMCLGLLWVGCGNPEDASPPSFSPGAPQARRQGRASSARAAVTHTRAPVVGRGGALVPPPEPGASRSSFDGCLAQPTPSEDSDTRFPATTGVGSLTDASPVTTRSTAAGLLVEQPLDHECGLTAQVDSYLKDGTVTVTRTLSGKSCRCMCHSTVKTAVRLPPGTYTLRVVTLDHGTRTVVHEGPVTVTEPAPPSSTRP
ncbi:hypothetical protein OV207_00330 [Corallococcus sp. BB11-1]|uniref:hypothetical protein n=1 Tax=Corallococcus sp. BB11-1 TaxID=2996783 RepID=UPI00226D6134|nr:hypothetical protein [Corallococcus sp. BB11-1]MCY1029888.1 hypothetical protein [Corallococcus sp. BB11-1]